MMRCDPAGLAFNCMLSNNRSKSSDSATKCGTLRQLYRFSKGQQKQRPGRLNEEVCMKSFLVVLLSYDALILFQTLSTP